MDVVPEFNQSVSTPSSSMVSYSDLILRPLLMSDADDYIQWFTDEENNKFDSWHPKDDFSKQEDLKFFEDTVMNSPWHKMMILSDRAVGMINVVPLKGEDRCRAQIGYLVAPEYRGRGIATTAVKIAVNDAFVEWGHLERIEGLVDIENTASQRVLEKAGFTREGVLRKYILYRDMPRDLVMFSMLRTDLILETSNPNHDNVLRSTESELEFSIAKLHIT